MSAGLPSANGAAPPSLLADRFPAGSDLVIAVEDFWGRNGAVSTADGRTYVLACPSCHSKSLPKERAHQRYPLIVRLGGDRGWELARTCGCSEASIAAALKPRPGGLRFATATEIRGATPDEPDWVWDGYVARGSVTIIAGKPKAGKSTLVCALLKAAVSGEPELLGRAVAPGPAVYVSEESAVTLAGKLPDAASLRVLTREAAWPRPPWPDVVAAAAVEAAHAGAALLAVDTFGFWAQLAAERENDAGAVQEAVAPLVEPTRAGIAVVLVHHTRKQGGEGGDSVRGSSAIAGAADAVIELERVAGGRAIERGLKALARWPQAPDKLLIDRDPVTTSWGVVEDARAAGRRDEAAERVAGVLRDAGGERLSGAEVARRLGKRKDNSTVHRTLARLERRGEADRDDRGWGLSDAAATTLIQPALAESGAERDGGVVSRSGDDGDNAEIRRSCQGGPSPEGGAADGNPLGNGSNDERARP